MPKEDRELTSVPTTTPSMPNHRASRATMIDARDFKVRVETEWEVIGGRAEPIRVTIEAGAGSEHVPLTAELIRRLPLGEVIAEARRDLAWEGGRRGLPNDPVDVVREAARSGPLRGSRLSEDELAMVAAVYTEARRWGRPVTEAVAEHFHISTSTAGKRIMKARAAGLLEGIGPKR